jgi:deoxyhypusine synthase
MVRDPECSIILTIAGSAGAAGCLAVFADLLRYNLVDAVVATGAAVVDMDFFEATGTATTGAPPRGRSRLRRSFIDRIYGTHRRSCSPATPEPSDRL